MNLIPDQLQAINWQLHHNNVLVNDALIAELTDHFAAAIAGRMATGEDFDAAGQHVLTQFGGWRGLADLQTQYVRAQNRAAWQAFGRIARQYVAGPRLLITLPLLTGTYWLLTQYGQRAFWALLILNVAICVVVGWADWNWKPDNQKLDWNRMYPADIRNRLAGLKWVANVTYVVALNVPIYLYLFFFPIFSERPFDGIYPVISAIGITAGYVAFACIAELTYRQNPLVRRFA